VTHHKWRLFFRSLLDRPVSADDQHRLQVASIRSFEKQTSKTLRVASSARSSKSCSRRQANVRSAGVMAESSRKSNPLPPQPRGFAIMLTASLLVAGVDFAGPLFFWEPAPRLEFVFFVLLPALWGILLLVAFFRYRFRGLWFLLGVPFVVGWPLFAIMLALGGI
jgi:hypothetical protein